MSNQQDTLDEKLAHAKQLLNRRVKSNTAVEVAKTRSPIDYVLWIVAAICLIVTTFVRERLPGYLAAANDLWVQIAIIVGLIVVALVCLAMTHQGKAFKTLLVDAGVELRRVTWPSKNETFHWTWVVMVAIVVFGFIVWLLDTIFNQLIGYFIG